MTGLLNDDIATFIARAVPNYEVRPQQVEMARAVALAMDAAKHLVVEAGTGVWKSFAYLLPAIRRSLVERRRAIFSKDTRTVYDEHIHNNFTTFGRVCSYRI